ncbi:MULTISPECIES: hypothetical protein [unclassified Mucilaginibacter]|uniref:hypothetical protein n=1 Tax=unclassified Mucilaginibacter TaxID=2617802 RepID=UPI0031F63DF1
MKKLLLILTCAAITLTANAQKYVPQIKAGTVLNYTANARAMGQTLPAILTISELNAPMRIKWVISGLGTGMFEISAKAIQSGNKMALREPGFDAVTKLKDNETLAFLSKDTFNSLLTNKAFELNGQTFTVTESATPYVLDGKETDTFYAVTKNGKTKLWILNSADFPLICKIEGAPQGIDLTLNSVQ